MLSLKTITYLPSFLALYATECGLLFFYLFSLLFFYSRYSRYSRLKEVITVTYVQPTYQPTYRLCPIIPLGEGQIAPSPAAPLTEGPSCARRARREPGHTSTQAKAVPTCPARAGLSPGTSSG